MANEQQPSKKSSTGLDENIASLICYAGWWITGIIFIVIEKDNKTVKFHAWQSLITFGAINITMIAFSVLSFIPFHSIIGGLVWLGGIILWAFMMYKAYSGEMFKLPTVGDLAEKQAGN